jgi:DNA-binding transcriptional ArsR family regulator
MVRLPVCECESVHRDVVNEVTPQLLNENEAIDLASLFKLFGDGTRVRILQALRVHELCVCDLACLLGMTKSAISHQLKALRLSNLVKFRREGQNVFYSLADEHVEAILDIGLEHLRE